jgi:hypothetical protein
VEILILKKENLRCAIKRRSEMYDTKINTDIELKINKELWGLKFSNGV